jgi:hypothetical protein
MSPENGSKLTTLLEELREAAEHRIAQQLLRPYGGTETYKSTSTS